MTATQDNYPTVHQELIGRHKQNFRRHAEAVLGNLKEFRETGDCGAFWVKTDTRLVEAWSVKVGVADHDSLRALCASIEKGESTPALDRLVSMYVCTLTGKLPNGQRFFMN
ncbi:MAG: hypothetical protein P4L53_09005 [Candidatus Obscuribacterales bacterium]|nr:hypothetical protein [Candidatus Obscuribacterales bacterium]